MAAPIIAPVAIALAREFLPGLASRLVGPRREAVARQVVQTASTLLGKPVATMPPAEIVAELDADPNVADVMRQELAEIARAEEEAVLRDRIDARDRYLLLHDSDRRWLPYLVGGEIIIVMFAASAAVWLEAGGYEAPQTLALLVAIATAAAIKLGSVVDFFFGSSQSSRAKDAALTAAALERQEPAPPKLVVEELLPTEPPVQEPPAPKPTAPGAPARDFVAELLAMPA